MALKVFGDSITYGYPVSSNQIWAKIVADEMGTTLTNAAVSSSQAADQGYLAMNSTPSSTDTFGIMLGVNDLTYYGNNATKREAYINYLRGLIVWLACPTRVTGWSTTKTGGSWGNYNPCGSYCGGLNEYATASASGDAIYVGFRNQNNSDTASANSEVRVDSTLKGTRTGNGSTIGNTYLGQAYAPQVFRVAGCGAGSHSVQVKNVTNTKYTLLDFIAGSDQSVKPHVYVLNIPLRNPDLGYRADYNADIATMVSELAGDGLNVHLVDISDILTTGDLTTGDGLHIEASGHAKIANEVLIAMGLASEEEPFTGTKTYDYVHGGTVELVIDEDVVQSITIE